MRNIKRLRSWISMDRKQGCCEYFAPDAETLREAYHTAKVKFARVWPAMLFEGDAPPDTQPGASWGVGAWALAEWTAKDRAFCPPRPAKPHD